MRHLPLILIAALLAAAAPARATSPDRPNTLTKKQIQRGWLLLFDGQTQFGWTPHESARWVVSNGTLTPIPGSGRGVLATNTEFGSFRLEADVWVDNVANSGIFVRGPRSGPISGANAYEINVYDPHPQWPSGSINDVARATGRVRTVGKWNHYEITADGDHLKVRVNDDTVVDTHDKQFRRGTVGLQYNGEGEVRFRNVRLQPLGREKLFNGRDLTGWKQIPGRASVYTVTKEGWLNVKNGNGDLQTTSQWGDFVLQLDIISNGTHLNSGVFFRGTPGEFWSGYEAQIRNQWQGNDRTKPVDFGTGGVYNRQPARRVVSSDREWFKMTVVAHGNHIATWVNGYQVADYTDTRPANNNARNGYRAAPGIISLQGHDPTTDLSFRNIEVRELPRAQR